MFYNVTLPVCVWFINRAKKNPGKFLFIDARKMGMMVDKTHRELSDAENRYDNIKKEDKPWAQTPPEECDIQKIASLFRSFENNSLEDEKGFYSVADLETVKKKDYVLTPSIYVGVEENEISEEEYEDKMARLSKSLSILFDKDRELEAKVRLSLNKLGINI